MREVREKKRIEKMIGISVIMLLSILFFYFLKILFGFKQYFNGYKEMVFFYLVLFFFSLGMGYIIVSIIIYLIELKKGIK